MILAFLLALPISVWLLSNVYSIIDEPSPVFAVLRLVVGICLVLILLLMTDRTLLSPLAYALATVTLLHITAFWLLRTHAVGVPIFQRVPPPPPLLSEQPNLNDELLLAEESRNSDLD